MLLADELDALVDPIVALYERYTQSVINDIARRLARMDMTATAAWQMQRLTESGLVFENAITQLSRITGKSKQVLRDAFQRAGVQTMEFDDAIYRSAGLNPLPLNLSPAMARVLAAGLSKTQMVVQNMTLTTATASQTAFVEAADLAYMQVSQGAMSYDQAIRAAVKQVAGEGVSVINYPTGHTDQLDVAMRRTVLTGVSQTSGELQIERMNEMGADLVQVSAHIGARLAHQIWQGKIFSRSGRSGKYPDFVSETGYGTGPGLMGWNCRHSFYPFFEGISHNAYKQRDLTNFADKTVTYNNKEISVYDATQYQRGIERKIRFYKRQATALQAAGLDNSNEIARIRMYQAQMRDFIRQTKLQRQPVRESVISLSE